MSVIRLKLPELLKLDDEIRRFTAVGKLQDGYKEVNEVLHHQELLFVLKIIYAKLINGHHDNFFVGHFSINKTRVLIGRKYYWLSSKIDTEVYIKGCDICLSFKAVKHKPYDNFQLLPIPTYG